MKEKICIELDDTPEIRCALAQLMGDTLVRYAELSTKGIPFNKNDDFINRLLKAYNQIVSKIEQLGK